MIYKLVFAPIEDLDQTASLRVLYIKARVQSFFKVKTKTDQTLGCADGLDLNICYVHMTTCTLLIHIHIMACCANNIFYLINRPSVTK